MISERQTRGVVAVSIILAVIPFICFLSVRAVKPRPSGLGYKACVVSFFA